jgi:hypothetical protein
MTQRHSMDSSVRSRIRRRGCKEKLLGGRIRGKAQSEQEDVLQDASQTKHTESGTRDSVAQTI